MRQENLNQQRRSCKQMSLVVVVEAGGQTGGLIREWLPFSLGPLPSLAIDSALKGHWKVK